MSAIDKVKVAMFPNIYFETIVGTFIDKRKAEIVPIRVTNKVLDKYAQQLFGDWCAPIKLHLALYEQAIVEKDVTKIIAVDPMICHYPLVLGNINNWVKKEFDYYPIEMTNAILSVHSFFDTIRKLSGEIPGCTYIRCMAKIPLVMRRYLLSKKLFSLYLKTLPLVKNPKMFKLSFEHMKQKFIEADSMKESKKVFNEFEKLVSDNKIRENPKYKILLTGDFSILSLGFHLIDLGVYLAKYEAELVCPFFISSSYGSLRFSKYGRKALKLFSKVFSSKNKKTEVNSHYIVELLALAQVFKGIEEGVDGIICVKPNMCPASDNLSHVLKQEKYFNTSSVEISYDEHSGVTGIITRLEAFMNIISEKES